MNSSLAGIAAFALALSIAACSDLPSSPESAAAKMLRAYGGPAGTARLGTFSGKGFIKDWSSETVARSFAFDIYRKGPLYKHKIMAAPGGALTDVIVVCFDGAASYAWTSSKGRSSIPAEELDLLKYRFPNVLQWIQEAPRTGEVLPSAKGQDSVRVRYRDGDRTVTLTLDRKSWLLSGIEVKNTQDSSAAFVESYDHYTEVQGIPFPQKFKAQYFGNQYYEYVLVRIDLESDLPDSLLRLNAADTVGIERPKLAKQPPASR
jgi:hypothetical protein